MVIYVDFFKLAGLVFIALLFLFVGLYYFVGWFKDWKKSGFCRHNFKFTRTSSFGTSSCYKCTKCSQERWR